MQKMQVQLILVNIALNDCLAALSRVMLAAYLVIVLERRMELKQPAAE